MGSGSGEREAGEERGEGRQGRKREERGREGGIGTGPPRLVHNPHVRNFEKYPDSRNTTEKIHKLPTCAAKIFQKFWGTNPNTHLMHAAYLDTIRYEMLF